MQEGRCEIHGTYFTDSLVGCPTCWASRVPSQWCEECGCLTNHSAHAVIEEEEG